jgi:hypothetical protein
MEFKMNIIANLMKNCKFCGEEFRSNRKRRNYCSDKCFDESVKKRQIKYSKDNKEEIYKRRTTCKYCGNKFRMEELKERCCGNEYCSRRKKEEKRKNAQKKYYNKNIKKTTKKFKNKEAEKSKNYRKRHIEQLNIRKQAKNREMRKWLDDIKGNKKCSKCKEDKFYILDFHHLDSDEKEKTISRAVSCGYGKKRIQEEINKCIVLCRNCHGWLHYLKNNVEGWQPTEDWLNNKEIYK